MKKRRLDPGLPQKHPILAALKLTGSEYILRTIKGIRSSDLDEALLVLPFTQIIFLLSVIKEWIKKVRHLLLKSGREFEFMLPNFVLHSTNI